MSVPTLTDKARLGFLPFRTRRAYQRVFSAQGSDVVLAHLADACGATETIADSDPLVMAVAEGRRQVWLVIQDMLRMSEGDLRDMQQRVAEMGGNDE